MNTSWTKPALVFVIGLLIGVGGMYLTGVRPQSAVRESTPDIVGLSGKGLLNLGNNKAVSSAQLVVNLTGMIQEIRSDAIVIANGDSAPITITVDDQTSVTGEAKENTEVPVFKLQDLKQYEFIQVFGSLKGDTIRADNVIRFVD